MRRLTKSDRVHPALLTLWRVWYALRARWRMLRISRAMTKVFGPQYRRSRDLIEIDITYACNLHCLNCNRSVTQAPDTFHMPIEMIRKFVEDSIRVNKRWTRIRVLGGEPTMHPQFAQIVEELLRYRAFHPACLVEVATNGHGALVEERIAALPPEVSIENSGKTSKFQPTFGPFNMAPVDDPKFARSDFRNGCAIMRDCGMALTPIGYFPCGVAGGIDRVTGDGIGRQSIPADDDDMLDVAHRSCQLCGRFRDGHYVPTNLRPALNEAKVSPTWEALYARWKDRRRQKPEATAG